MLVKTENKIKELEQKVKVSKNDRKRIFRRANYLVRTFECANMKQALIKCWKELKDYKYKLTLQLEGFIFRLRSAYNVELEINESLNRALNRGEDVL
jgi:hypothetical protein